MQPKQLSKVAHLLTQSSGWSPHQPTHGGGGGDGGGDGAGGGDGTGDGSTAAAAAAALPPPPSDDELVSPPMTSTSPKTPIVNSARRMTVFNPSPVVSFLERAFRLARREGASLSPQSSRSGERMPLSSS